MIAFVCTVKVMLIVSLIEIIKAVDFLLIFWSGDLNDFPCGDYVQSAS